MEEKKELIEIWGDVVELRDLVRAIAVSSITTMGMYFLAPAGNDTLQLFFGLGGALIGFIVSGMMIKPKRIIDSKNSSKNNNQHPSS